MKSIRPVLAYLMAYPVLLPLGFYLTWAAGRATLGHWPRPSFDDPKTLGSVVGFFYDGTVVLMTVGLGVFLAAWLGVVGMAVLRPDRRRSLALVAGVAALGMLVAVGFLRWDPLSVAAWFAD